MNRKAIIITLCVAVYAACGNFKVGEDEGKNDKSDGGFDSGMEQLPVIGTCALFSPCVGVTVCLSTVPVTDSPASDASPAFSCRGPVGTLPSRNEYYNHYDDYMQYYCPLAHNQMCCNWCTYFATAFSVEALSCKEGIVEEPLSEPHLAYVEKGRVVDCLEGGHIPKALEAVKRTAIVPLSIWPYEVDCVNAEITSPKPSDEILRQNGKFQIADWVRVSDVSRLRELIKAGHNIVLGVSVFWSREWRCDTDKFTWHKRKSPQAPFISSGYTLAYDAARRQTIMFPGASPGSINDSTWAWNGYNWKELSPAHSPPADLYQASASAYDIDRERIVLYGKEQTFEWNGYDWERKDSAHSPTLFAPVMGYDEERKKIVLAGSPVGENGYGPFETWVWDGTDWSKKSPIHSPSPRNFFSLAYNDISPHGLLLFGGWDAYGSLDDTWLWNGGNWVELHPAHSAGSRSSYAMTHAEIYGLREIILFGGKRKAPWERVATTLNDTWFWDSFNKDWKQISPIVSPPLTARRLATFDVYRNRTILPGGQNREEHNITWEFGDDCGVITVPANPKLNAYGHAIVLIGYNDLEEVFYFRNSWGPNWAEGGYGRLTYEFVVQCSAGGGYPTKRR